MSAEDVEQQLAGAQERLQKAAEALSQCFGPGKLQEYQVVHEEMLTLERELAALRGDEYAVPVDFPVKWDVGAPLPHLLRSEHRTFLIFVVLQPDPAWDGTYVTVRDPASGTEELLAVVEFTCSSVRMGVPNDEVHEGHPLYGRGLCGYTAQKVENSRWLAEAERINSVHRCYNPASWRELSHYVFWFHDSTFECLARGYTVELHRDTFSSVVSLVCRRLLRLDPD